MPQLNAKVPVVTQRLEGEIVRGEVLAPLAERINGDSGDKVLRASVTIADGRLAMSVRAQTDAAGRLLTSVGADVSQLEAVTKLQDMRVSVQRWQRSPEMLEFENEVFRLGQHENRIRKSPRVTEALSECIAADLLPELPERCPVMHGW